MRSLLIASTARVLLAIAHGEIPIGIAVVTSTLGLEHGRIAELPDLYVLPEYRRGGRAAMLIEAVGDWARDRACEVLDVVVDAHGDARHELSRYYHRHGFTDGGRRLLTRPISPSAAAAG